MPGQEWCFSHHPEHAEERKKRASRGGKAGGRGRPNAELRTVKTLCEDLTRRVLSGEIPPGVGAVVNQIANTRLRAVEQERKLREMDEIEERLTRLEEAAEAEKGGRAWRA